MSVFGPDGVEDDMPNISFIPVADAAASRLEAILRARWLVTRVR